MDSSRRGPSHHPHLCQASLMPRLMQRQPLLLNFTQTIRKPCVGLDLDMITPRNVQMFCPSNKLRLGSCQPRSNSSASRLLRGAARCCCISASYRRIESETIVSRVPLLLMERKKFTACLARPCLMPHRGD